MTEVEPTEVVVQIEADAQVRGDTQTLRVEIWAAVEGDGNLRYDAGCRSMSCWNRRLQRNFPTEGLAWPVIFPVLPLADDDARVFELVVQALNAAGEVLVEQRAVSGFAPGRRGRVTVVLEASCAERARVCEPDTTCRGALCGVCRAGECDRVGIHLPSDRGDLERLPWDAGVPQTDGDTPQTDGDTPGDASGPDSGAPDAADAVDGTVQDAGDTGAPACQEGSTRCTGTGSRERALCDGGELVSATPCDAEQVCDSRDEAEPGACAPLADQCIGHAGESVCVGAVLHTCTQDSIALPSPLTCDSDRHCQLGVERGACAVCLPDTYLCEGRQLRRCGEDGSAWNDLELCATVALCNPEARACTDQTCLPGGKVCQGDDLLACNDQQTGFDVEEECGAGLCDPSDLECDVCVPETRTCTTDGLGYRECNAAGSGYDAHGCPGGQPLCTGSGTCVQCRNAGDCADPGECRSPACNAGSCGSSLDGRGTACTLGGGADGLCTASGSCVRCLDEGDTCTLSGGGDGVCDDSNTCVDNPYYADPVIPSLPPGGCPTFTSGSFDFMGLQGEMEAGPIGSGDGALLFYWHGTGGSAGSFRQPFGGLGTSNIQRITSAGGIIFAVQGSTGAGDSTCSGTGVFDGDFTMIDRIVACAVQDHDINPRRIYSTGCSAGGLQSGCMAARRADYMAAVTTNSGGLTSGFGFTLDNAQSGNVPFAMTMHGGEGDTVAINFGDASALLDDLITNAGGFAVDCNHMSSHCGAPSELRDSSIDFLLDHPFGLEPPPYQTSLPASFPDYCIIW